MKDQVTKRPPGQHLIQIDLNDAISYNSLIELKGVIDNKIGERDAALIAVALKSRKVLIIMILPSLNNQEDDQKDQESNRYFILNKFTIEQKPTCLLQISRKFLAVATGFLKE